MVDIARLSMEVNTSSVRSAKQDVQKLARAARESAQSSSMFNRLLSKEYSLGASKISAAARAVERMRASEAAGLQRNYRQLVSVNSAISRLNSQRVREEERAAAVSVRTERQRADILMRASQGIQRMRSREAREAELAATRSAKAAETAAAREARAAELAATRTVRATQQAEAQRQALLMRASLGVQKMRSQEARAAELSSARATRAAAVAAESAERASTRSLRAAERAEVQRQSIIMRASMGIQRMRSQEARAAELASSRDVRATQQAEAQKQTLMRNASQGIIRLRDQMARAAEQQRAREIRAARAAATAEVAAAREVARAEAQKQRLLMNASLGVQRLRDRQLGGGRGGGGGSVPPVPPIPGGTLNGYGEFYDRLVGIRSMMLSINGLMLSFGAVALYGALNQYTELHNLMQTLGFSASGAAARLQDIQDVAARTRAPMDELVRIYQKTTMAGNELGASQADILKFTESVGLALAQQGGASASTRGALLQLTQAMGGGIVRAEEFNSMLEGAYPILLAVAKGHEQAGGSVMRLRNIMLEGKLTSKDFYQALLSQHTDLVNTFGRTNPTLAQGFVVLRNSLTMFVGQMDHALGFSTTLARGILRVAEAFRTMGMNAQQFATYFRQAGMTIVALVGTIVARFVLIRAASLALTITVAATTARVYGLAAGLRVLQGSAVAAAGSMAALRGTMVATGILAISVALGYVANKLFEASQQLGSFGKVWDWILEIAGNVAMSVANYIGYLALSLVKGAARMNVAWSSFIRDMVSGAKIAFNRVIGIGVGSVKAIVAAWKTANGDIGVALEAISANVLDGISWMVNEAIDLLNMPIRAANALRGLAGYDPVDLIQPVDPAKWASQASAAGEAAGEAARQAFDSAISEDYTGGVLDGTIQTLDTMVNSYEQAAQYYDQTAQTYYDEAIRRDQLAVQGARGLARAMDGVHGPVQQANQDIVQLGGTLGDLGDATDKAGKKGAKAKKDMGDLSDAVLKLQKEIDNKLIAAVEGVSQAFGDWVMRGFQDFRSFSSAVVDEFKRMLSELIALSLKNRILVQLGLDPLSQQLRANGVQGVGQHSGLIGSVIGSFQPGAGGLLGGMGTVGRGIAGGWVQGGGGLGGILGGIQGGLGAGWSTITAGLGSGTIAGVATAIGAAVPIIAGVMAVVSVAKKLFGRTLKDTGIEGTFNMAEGLAASTYKFYKGGLFRSNKTKRSALDGDVAGPLERSMYDIGESVLDMAESIGVAGASLDALSFKFKFSTKGLSEQEVKDRLQEEFERFADAAADSVVAGLGNYLKQGESSFEGLERLSGALKAANAGLDMLGGTLYEVSLAGADMASELADLFGGIDAMSSSMSNYFEKFYTETEKRAYLERMATESLREHNLTLPRTRDEYRSMVDSLDLTTQSGREAFAALMGLADALDTLLPVISSLTQGVLDAIGGVATQVDLQIEFAQSMAQELRAAASDWFRASRSLRDTIRDLFQSEESGARESDRLAASAAAYRRAFEAAKTGDLEAAQQVGDLARTYIENLRRNSGSSQEFARREAMIRSELGLLAGIAELEGASKDVQAQLYENMIVVLQDLKTFLETQGMTEDVLAGLDQNIQDMYRDFDGTIAGFESQLASLTSAIEHAESLTYDAIMGNISVNMDVITRANIPADVKQLLVAANDGIRATVDFIARSDLPPDLKWLALTAQSEHAKTVNMLAGRQLPRDVLQIALTNISDMQKTVHLVAGSTIPDDVKRIALAGNSELARRVNVQLSTLTDNNALRVALLSNGSVTRTINGIVNTGRLTPAQTALLESISGASAGHITLGGTFRFDPSGAFVSWYGDTTERTITNPMNNLRSAIDALRAAVQAAQNDAQHRSLVASGGAFASQNIATSGGGNWLATSQQISGLAASMGISTSGKSAAQLAHEIVNFDSNDNIRQISNISNLRDYLWSRFMAVGGRVRVDEQDYKRLYPDVAQNPKYAGKSGQEHFDDWGRRDMFGEFGPARPFYPQAFDWSSIGLTIPGYATGGMHGGGVRIVGEEGPELEVTGPSRIYSASDTRNMLTGGSDEELRLLREEVRMLRQENGQGQAQMAKQSRKMADMLRKWDIDGQPAERTGGEMA